MNSYGKYWKIDSGDDLFFSVAHEASATFFDIPGVFMYTKIERGIWVPVYVDQTASFRDLMPRLLDLPSVLGNGATHVHVRNNWFSESRLAEREALIQTYNPICNRWNSVA